MGAREPSRPGAVEEVRTDSVEGRPTEDAELVERAKTGDQDAYAELVTRYQAIAARTAYGRRPTVGLSVVEDRASSDTALSPEASALARERREVVLAALRRMREDDRLVIAYRYFFDLSEAEMAEALGVARGTVKSRLSRALARLRENMEGETTGGE